MPYFPLPQCYLINNVLLQIRDTDIIIIGKQWLQVDIPEKLSVIWTHASVKKVKLKEIWPLVQLTLHGQYHRFAKKYQYFCIWLLFWVECKQHSRYSEPEGMLHYELGIRHSQVPITNGVVNLISVWARIPSALVKAGCRLYKHYVAHIWFFKSNCSRCFANLLLVTDCVNKASLQIRILDTWFIDFNPQ